MPFKSDKQRRFMYAKHPGIAKRWTAEHKAVLMKLSAKRKKKRGS